MYDIERLKNEVKLLDVCRYLGVPIEKHGVNAYIACPEHEERKHDNCVCYNDNHYHCFSCGATGSVFDFVMHVRGVDFKEVIRFIAHDIAGYPEETYVQREKKKYPKRLVEEDVKFLDMANGSVYALISIGDEAEGDKSAVCWPDYSRYSMYLNFKLICTNPLNELYKSDYKAYSSLVRTKARDKILELRRWKKVLEGSLLDADIREIWVKETQEELEKVKSIFVSFGGEFSNSKSVKTARPAVISG